MSRSGLSEVWMIQRKGTIVQNPKKRQPAMIARVRPPRRRNQRPNELAD
jgi:hypothetical protein